MAGKTIEELIKAEFEKELKESRTIPQCLEAIKRKTATFKDAAKYSDEIGSICSDAFKKFCCEEYISTSAYELAAAKGAITSNLKTVSDMGADVAAEIQQILNEKADIGLAAKRAEFDKDAAQNLAEKFAEVAQEEGLDRAQWVLDEPVKTFSRKVVDETVRENVKFQARSGLSPIIRRTMAGKGCPWCAALAGKYEYGAEPEDVYRRHERCKCLVEYFPGDGKRQNVHNKKWYSEDGTEIQQIKKAERILPSHAKSVRGKYFKYSSPGVGQIEQESGYKHGKHKHELETAAKLHDLFGGDILCLNENLHKEKYPDYLWNGMLWELKKTSPTRSSVDNQIRSGLQQIKTKPGGLILDFGDEFAPDTIWENIEYRFMRSAEFQTMDVIVIQRGGIFDIVRYKK